MKEFKDVEDEVFVGAFTDVLKNEIDSPKFQLRIKNHVKKTRKDRAAISKILFTLGSMHLSTNLHISDCA